MIGASFVGDQPLSISLPMVFICGFIGAAIGDAANKKHS